MERISGLTLRWLGRLLILLGPAILVGALFLPDVVQPLNTFVCRDGLELDNARPAIPGGPTPGIELVCVQGTYAESAGREVLLIAVGSVALGLAALYVSASFLRPRYRAPDDPGHR